MSRIIIVSNRLGEDPTGGLAVALSDVVQHHEVLWVGWDGNVEDGREGLATSDTTAAFALSKSEHTGYYLGYANSVLWPVMHNRLDLARFEAEFHPTYDAVNRRVATLLAPLVRPTDVIWVHDYHLLPLALHLRRLGIDVPIGFFLHIPFPPPQVFFAVPEHVRLAEALASYDLVGLQTSPDVANLIAFMRLAVTGQLLQDGRLRAFNRIAGLRSFPVGIDPASMLPPDLDEPEPSARPRRQIVGVDRLDYSKGLPEKFRAFGRFLERYAQYRGDVVLLQIASPTRESVEAYADIRQQLEGLAGSINGRHGELDWVPINYINRAVPRLELPEIYRNSIVGLVTPLCDGMNLVAKEYVAAQRSNDPGVLILSRFAGAAEQLQEALIVNPYNAEEVAQAIDQALQMPRVERCERHASLMRKVQAESARHWASSFLETLRAHANARSPRDRDESLAFHMPAIADAYRSEELLGRLNT